MNTAEKLSEFETRPGMTYATHDSVALAGDLYLPKGTGPYPMLVGVHGGGWVQGARGQFQHWGKYLAARGVALFAISYRFATAKQKTFPHAVQDVLAAIQFARGNAKEFNVAPDRIGVFGIPPAAISARWRRSAGEARCSRTVTRRTPMPRSAPR